MTRTLAAAALLVSVLTISAVEPAGAVPPANDNFADAQNYFVSSPTVVTVNTLDATSELGEPVPSCGSTNTTSVWFRVGLSNSAPIQVTAAGSDFDTQIAIYEGSTLASLQEVGCDNNNVSAGGAQSFRVFEAQSSSTYYVQVSGFSGASGNLSIQMNQLSCGPNTIWQVESTGSNGFAELNDALVAAGQCGSFGDDAFVHVATGSHTPDEQDNFNVTGNVTVEGGYTTDFVGAPDPIANPTVLEGSLGGQTVRALGSNVQLDGLTITNGFADGTDDSGGGIFSTANQLTVRNSVLSNNTASGTGGAIHHIGGSFTMRDSTVENNTSDGAPVSIDTTSRVTIATSTIDNNNGVFGGGVQIDGSTNALITNTILGSTTGSPLLVEDSRLRVMNTIIDVDATPSMRLFDDADVSFYNSVITGATTGISVESASAELLVKNSIVWGVSGAITPGSIVTSIEYENSIVEGSGGSSNWDSSLGTNFGGNLDVDPQWVDPINDNFRLQIGSPAIDAGDDNDVPLDLDDIDNNGISNTEKIPDLDLTARIKQADIDLGPYELAAVPCQPIIFVNANAAPGGNGLTWPTALRSLQLALEQAEACVGVTSAIWIAGGTYVPHPTDRTVRFELPDNVTLIGGFAGTENSPADRPAVLPTTTLSGDLNGDDNGGLPGADNSQGVVEIEAPRLGLLADLTIEGGNADGADGGDDTGGGIWIRPGTFFSSPTSELEMTNVVVRNNTAATFGGGIQASGPLLAIESVLLLNRAQDGAGINTSRNVEFTGGGVNANAATRFGGGIQATNDASVDLVGVSFSANSAGQDGGAIFSLGESLDIVGGSFTLNTAVDDGGAIDSNAPLTITSSEFAGNSSGGLGGAIYNSDQATVTNATFNDNTAVQAASTVFSDGQASTEIEIANSVVWGNTGPGDTVIDQTPNATSIRRSIIEGSGGSGAGWNPLFGTDLGGNLDADPQFTNVNGFDFTPLPGSPAIGTADAAVIPVDAFDLDGDGDTNELTPDVNRSPRLQGNGVEIGSVEVADGLPGQTQVLATPCVVYDSTLASGSLAGAIDVGEIRTIDATGTLPSGQGGAGNCVPDGATAVTFLIAADSPQQLGNFRLSATGVVPNGGVVNVTANGLNNANTVTVPLSASGQVDVAGNANISQVGMPLAGVRLVALAYNLAGAPSGFVPLTPCAVADSRSTQQSTGSFVGPFADGATYPAIDVVGTFPSGQGGGNTDCGVPSTADAVVVNVVAVNPTGGSGRIVIGANGTTASEGTPFAPIGMNNAAVAIVPLAGDQTLTVDIDATAGATTNVRLVVLGYLETNEGATFIPVNPCAAFDTRFGTGNFGGLREGGETTTYQISSLVSDAQGGATEAGSCGVPANATGVLLNLVAVNATGGGNLQVSAAGAAPTGGVLNFAALSPAMPNANTVPVQLSVDGEIDVFVNAGASVGVERTNVRGVVLGYYIDLPQAGSA